MFKKPIPDIDPSSIKALALDLDGTVLRPNSILGEPTVRVLKALIARNIAIIIVTGRSTQSAEPYRRAIGAEGPMVYCNGAEVIFMPGLKPIMTSLMEPDIVNYCVDLARDLRIYIHIFLPRKEGEPWELLLAEGYEREATVYTKRTGLNVYFEDIKAVMARPENKGCIKIMFIADEDMLMTVRKRINARLGNRVYMTRSFPRFLEIMAGSVNKGNGLTIALNHLNISGKNVIAFGDADNDVPLFEAAGYSAAVANANGPALEAAGMIIGSNIDDGVAVFLERLFSV